MRIRACPHGHIIDDMIGLGCTEGRCAIGHPFLAAGILWIAAALIVVAIILS